MRARVCIYIILEILWIYLTRYLYTNFQIMFCIHANIHTYIMLQGTRLVYIIKLKCSFLMHYIAWNIDCFVLLPFFREKEHTTE